MLKLGDIVLDMPFIQAPLSGYSNYAMRKLAADYGAPLCFSGMILAKSVLSRKAMQKGVFNRGDGENVVGCQILGSEPQIMAEAAKRLEGLGYALIDLNFACPVPKVIKAGRGGALINEPALAIEIFRSVKAAVKCPVTVKIRPGFDNSHALHENFWQIASAICGEGAAAITVHCRGVRQRHTGKANLGLLAEIKARLPSAVIIGSGGMFDAGEIIDVMKTTGIDGAAIARAAIGNPWIFKELRALFKGKEKPAPPDIEEQGRVVLEHFQLMRCILDTRKSILQMRKFFGGYCRYHPEGKKAQRRLIAAKNDEELLLEIKELYGVSCQS